MWVGHLSLGVWDQPGQYSETPSLLKLQKISWVWWWVPVIPTTWEAEAGESLEPRRQRLQQAEITPLHSSLGNKSLKIKKPGMVAGTCNPRQENRLNPGDRGCSWLRLRHWTPAWATRENSFSRRKNVEEFTSPCFVRDSQVKWLAQHRLLLPWARYLGQDILDKLRLDTWLPEYFRVPFAPYFLSLEVLDELEQHSEALSLQKIQKIARHGSMYL